MGRVAATDNNGNSLWSKIEDYWLNLYKNKKEVAGMSVMHKVSFEDEWLAEAYMETDYNQLCIDDFKKAMSRYLGFLVQERGISNKFVIECFDKYRQGDSGNAVPLNTDRWRKFLYTDIFNLRGGYYNKKPEHATDGNIPFLGSTDSNNGVTEYYSIDDIKQWDKTGKEDNVLGDKLFDGNCISVTVDGSVCNAYYQTERFTCSHSITSCYLKYYKLNPYIAVFLCTLIMKEKYRWSYGRKPHDIEKFGRSVIELPVDSNGEPDWQFMEDYIKSLPYGDRI